MALFRVQNKTPEVYTSTSRDFQLIGRLYDCVINGIKFDIDSMTESLDTDACDSKLLSLLQTKLGFFSKMQIPDDSLRYILKAFPDIIKNKGSLKGIEQAVLLFLKINNVKSEVHIDVINKSITHPYIIQIGLDMDFRDTKILDEILKYIVPTGYAITYSFYKDIGSFDINLESRIGTNIIVVKDSVNSLLRGNYIVYNNYIEDGLIGGIGETQIALPYDSTFMGTVNSVYDLPNYPNPLDEDVGKLYTVKSLDFKEIYNKTSEQIDIANYISSYICVYDKALSKNVWVKLENNHKYDVFESAIYGYYLENNDIYLTDENGNILVDNDNSIYLLNGERLKDSFYIDRDSYYKEDDVYSQYGFKISNDSHPGQSAIPAFKDGYLFDKTSDTHWRAVYDSIDEVYYWEKDEFSDVGIQILGSPDQANIIPKKNMKIYRQANSDGTVQEAIWLAEFFNNNYIWGDIVTDSQFIDLYKDDTCITIEGRPIAAKILPIEGLHVYNNSTKQSWTAVANEDGSLIWRQDGVESDGVEILGSPDQAQIVPNHGVHVYNDHTSWTAVIDEYTSIIDSPKSNVLYIDKDTSNGYRYNGSGFDKVLSFMRASNVYEVSKEELNFMIENGTLRPAFKNNTTIFRDIFGNILLL